MFKINLRNIYLELLLFVILFNSIQKILKNLKLESIPTLALL